MCFSRQGLALICLALYYWLLDIKRWRGRWTKPFLVFGMNAIVAYVLSELVADSLDRIQAHLADGTIMTWHEIVYENAFAPLANPANASLLYAIAYVAFCWVFVWILYRKGIFLRV